MNEKSKGTRALERDCNILFLSLMCLFAAMFIYAIYEDRTVLREDTGEFLSAPVKVLSVQPVSFAGVRRPRSHCPQIERRLPYMCLLESTKTGERRMYRAYFERGDAIPVAGEVWLASHEHRRYDGEYSVKFIAQ